MTTATRSTKSQSDALLRALRRKPVTSLQALSQLGIARAAARVYDLRSAGHAIHTETIEVSNSHGDICRVAEYHLLAEAGQGRAATC